MQTVKWTMSLERKKENREIKGRGKNEILLVGKCENLNENRIEKCIALKDEIKNLHDYILNVHKQTSDNLPEMFLE
jgi:hypothetical protein